MKEVVNRMRWGVLLCCLLMGGGVGWAAPAGTLPKDARLAIIGDSITEAKKYSVFMETYLLACQGRSDVTVFQFGWGGERADGFATRAENDLAVFKPTAATTCYGMNDGGYKTYNDGIGSAYASNMTAVIRKLQAAGVQMVVVGSPGVVDADTFKLLKVPGAEGSTPASIYNENLRQLRDQAERVAGEQHALFADVYTPMMEAMTRAKKELGPVYDVAGKDGVHPGDNGHLIMAAAFLKALGCGGDIGSITVDMKGSAIADGRHRVLASAGNRVELESVRYPFCFAADPNSRNASTLRSVLPFVPFNRDLNRLMLSVRNLEAPVARVTWGKGSRDFTREQLAAGINLMEFFMETPFDEAFRKVKEGVEAKQDFETKMIKGFLTAGRGSHTGISRAYLDGAERDQFQALLMGVHARMDAANKKAVAPVRHTIQIEPLPAATEAAGG